MGSRRPSRWQETPRALFARRFSELYEAAGNPTLRRVESAAKARMAAAHPRGPFASAQRISDWKAGRNVPAKFDFFRPVLLTLIEEAGKASTPTPQALLSVPAWERLWSRAESWNPDDAAAPSPYLGLAAYDRHDTDVFFGRTRSTTEFVDLVRRVAAPDGTGGIVMLVGASGAGKSSLLAAGLVPRLTGSEQAWQIATLTPGPDPTAALATALEPTGEWPAGTPRLLIVDQLEELFTQGSAERDRDEFLSAIQHLALPDADTPTAVVVSIRADFFASCLDHPVLEDALKHRSYLLGPMRLDELAEAINRPAELAGYRLEPGLEELIITELCGLGDRDDRQGYDPGALPLLSHVMQATWQRREAGRLTIEGYRAAGGVLGSVAATAENAWAGLDSIQQEVGKQILLELITVGFDSKDTRRRVPRDALAGAASDSALETLTRTRLITLDTDSAYLTHEIVLDAWPRLRGWLDEDRVGFLERQRLQNDAAEWAATGRDRSRLYRGARLAAVEHSVGRGSLGPIAGDFLGASQQARRRAHRRALVTRGGVALLTVVVVVLAGIAFAQRESMNGERQDAILAAILANADRLQNVDPTLSAQLDLVANAAHPGDPAILARIVATQNLPSATTLAVTGHPGSSMPFAYRPDGKVLAVTDGTGSLRLWNVEQPEHPYELASVALPSGSWIIQLRFSADGTVLAGMELGHEVLLWNLQDPSHPSATGAVSAGSDTNGAPLDLSPTQPVAAILNRDNTIQLWNISAPATPTPVATLPNAQRGQVRVLSYSHDGTLLATASDDDRMVQIWNVADPSRAVSLSTVHLDGRGYTDAIAISPDNRLLAASGDDGRVRLLDIENPTAPQVISTVQTEKTTRVMSVSFAPDSRTLATSGLGNAIELWNLDDITLPRRRGAALRATDAEFDSVAFAPDGHTVATSGGDGHLRLWSLPNEIIGGHSAFVFNTGFDADGGLLAASWDKGEIQVWDTRGPDRPRRIGRLDGGETGHGLTISPDGHTLAARVHGEIQLFDITDRSVIRPIGRLRPGPEMGETIGPFAFGPDSKTLTLVGNREHGDATLQTWNLADRSLPVAAAPGLDAGPWVSDLHYGADGRTLVTIGDGIRLWDNTDPLRPVLTSGPLTPSIAGNTTLALSDDGEYLAATGGGVLQVWSLHDLAHPNLLTSTTIGRKLSIWNVSFSPHADTLVAGTGTQSGALDATLKMWDFTDHQHLVPTEQQLLPPGTGAFDARFVPGSDTLALAATGGTIQLWNLNAQQIIDHICSVGKAALTRRAWDRYVPQLPYRSPCP